MRFVFDEQFNVKPYSSAVLAVCGIALSGVGLYFIFLRSVLLPEDERYIGASLSQLQATAPNLLDWLGRMFWVMGGYILTTGILTLYIAHLFSEASAWRVGSRCSGGLNLNWLDDPGEFYHSV